MTKVAPMKIQMKMVLKFKCKALTEKVLLQEEVSAIDQRGYLPVR